MNYSSDRKIHPDHFGDAFLTEEPRKIYNQCIPEFRDVFTFEKFEKMVRGFNKSISKFHLQHTSRLGGHTHYLWVDSREKKALSVYFDTEYMIHRLVIRPYIIFKEFGSSVSGVKYSMPVKDDWLIFWGGENEFVNYHYLHTSQRYAYDLLMMKDGRTFAGSPEHNSNFHAFNKEVTAPAGGKVVKAVDNIKDNTPGEMNASQLAGNHVIIQHAQSEYSFVAHLKESSLTVDKGDVVQMGEVIGRCGNSGNSSEAHIHFQVMDRPKVNKGRSLQIQFVDQSRPVQGDIISQTLPRSSETFNPDSLESSGDSSIISSLSQALSRLFSR